MSHCSQIEFCEIVALVRLGSLVHACILRKMPTHTMYTQQKVAKIAINHFITRAHRTHQSRSILINFSTYDAAVLNMVQFDTAVGSRFECFTWYINSFDCSIESIFAMGLNPLKHITSLSLS